MDETFHNNIASRKSAVRLNAMINKLLLNKGKLGFHQVQRRRGGYSGWEDGGGGGVFRVRKQFTLNSEDFHCKNSCQFLGFQPSCNLVPSPQVLWPVVSCLEKL